MAVEPDTETGVMTVVTSGEIAVAPARVLEMARDFSERRAKVFPAVSTKRLIVHSSGATTADITEGTRAGPFVFWERCNYNWSDPGHVIATVTDANVYAIPGSSWTITAEASERGSRVEMTWARRFRRRPLGRFMGFVFRHRGHQIFGKYARDVLRNMETLESG